VFTGPIRPPGRGLALAQSVPVVVLVPVVLAVPTA